MKNWSLRTPRSCAIEAPVLGLGQVVELELELAVVGGELETFAEGDLPRMALRLEVGVSRRPFFSLVGPIGTDFATRPSAADGGRLLSGVGATTRPFGAGADPVHPGPERLEIGGLHQAAASDIPLAARTALLVDSGTPAGTLRAGGLLGWIGVGQKWREPDRFLRLARVLDAQHIGQLPTRRSGRTGGIDRRRTAQAGRSGGAWRPSPSPPGDSPPSREVVVFVLQHVVLRLDATIALLHPQIGFFHPPQSLFRRDAVPGRRAR